MESSNKVESAARTQVPGRLPRTLPTAPSPAENDMPPQGSLAAVGDETRAVPAATDPFGPVLETLKRLEQEDPKLASQGARLLGLFRRMWESCAAKHLESQRLEDVNQDLRAVNAQICREGDHLKQQQDEQLARFYEFEDGLDQTRQDLLDILKDWDSCTVTHIAVLTNALPRGR